MVACGNCSHWADGKRVIVHHDTVAEVRSCLRPVAVVWPSAVDKLAPGRYALRDGDVVKFYKIDKPTEGRWAGRTFVSAQAGDELHPIRNPNTRNEILVQVAADPQAAMLLYGLELGRCGHCGRTLTDETSRANGIGPVCAEKLGW